LRHYPRAKKTTIFLVFPQAQNCVRFSQVFNVDNDPQTHIRQQAPNSELSGIGISLRVDGYLLSSAIQNGKSHNQA